VGLLLPLQRYKIPSPGGPADWERRHLIMKDLHISKDPNSSCITAGCFVKINVHTNCNFISHFFLSYRRNSNTAGRGTRVRNWRRVNQGRLEITMLYKYFHPIQTGDFNKDRWPILENSYKNTGGGHFKWQVDLNKFTFPEVKLPLCYIKYHPFKMCAGVEMSFLLTRGTRW
jgi:hypothetical protein